MQPFVDLQNPSTPPQTLPLHGQDWGENQMGPYAVCWPSPLEPCSHSWYAPCLLWQYCWCPHGRMVGDNSPRSRKVSTVFPQHPRSKALGQATNIPRQLVRSTDGFLCPTQQKASQNDNSSLSQRCHAWLRLSQHRHFDGLTPAVLALNLLSSCQSAGRGADFLLVQENASFQPSLSQDSSISQPCKHTRRPPPPAQAQWQVPGTPCTPA